MALSRWSHSLWYIYEPVGSENHNPTLCISLCGHTDMKSLNDNLDREVDKIIEKSEMDISNYDRKELYLYLKYTRDSFNGQITREDYIKKLNFLRELGWNRYYLKNQSLPYRWKSEPIPLNEKVLVSKYRRNFKKTNKQEEYVKEYTNNYRYIVFQTNKKFKYKNKDGSYTEEIFNKYRHKFLFPENPILEGEEYIYHLDRKIIYNKKIDSETFIEKQKELIDSKILDLQKLRDKINS